MPSMPLPSGLANWLAANRSGLLDYNCFDGAFVRCLLGGILKLRRHFINNNFRYCIAHPKNLRAGLNTKPTSRAAIVNFYFHNLFPKQNLKAAGPSKHNQIIACGCSLPRLTRFRIPDLPGTRPYYQLLCNFNYFQENDKLNIWPVMTL